MLPSQRRATRLSEFCVLSVLFFPPLRLLVSTLFCDSNAGEPEKLP